MRTPDKYRVRSIRMPQRSLSVTTGSEVEVDIHTFQDDVRVIGCCLEVNAMVTDAMLNADGRVHAMTELSKAGAKASPGMIMRIGTMSGWTAAILAGGDLDKHQSLMFPEGMGMDFDDGETINMFSTLESIGAVEGHSLHNATVFYVER